MSVGKLTDDAPNSQLLRYLKAHQNFGMTREFDGLDQFIVSCGGLTDPRDIDLAAFIWDVLSGKRGRKMEQIVNEVRRSALAASPAGEQTR